MIKARHNTIKRMKLQGTVPLHKILEKKNNSEAHKEEIIATKMSYQLVPPDDHRCNIAERAIQMWKIILLAFLPGMLRLSHYIYGAK